MFWACTVDLVLSYTTDFPDLQNNPNIPGSPGLALWFAISVWCIHCIVNLYWVSLTYCTPAVPLTLTHTRKTYRNPGEKDYYGAVKTFSIQANIYLEKFIGWKRKRSRENFRCVQDQLHDIYMRWGRQQNLEIHTISSSQLAARCCDFLQELSH